MKKSIVLLFSFLFVSGVLFSQQEMRVCYDGIAHVTLPDFNDTCSYRWIASIAEADTYVLQDWSNTYLVTIDSITQPITVSCFCDCNLDSLADTLLYEVDILPYPVFSAGEIVGIDTVCYNSSPDTLRLQVDCSGGATPYFYQWEYSNDGEQWENIPGAIERIYQPNNLQNTTFYRLSFSSSEECGIAYSNSICVTTYEELQAATITSDSAQYCYNSIPRPLYIQNSASGADGVLTNQWQSYSSANSNWTDIIGATGTSYQPNALTETTSYRVKTTSPLCGTSVFSDPYTLNVFQPISAGEIQGDDFVCYETPSEIVFSRPPSGGGDAYAYQWQGTIDGVNFVNVPGANSAQYTTDSLTDTRHYRVIVTSTIGCSQDTSNLLSINVHQPFVPGTRISISGEDTVCYDSQPGRLVIVSSCTGGATPYRYQWQSCVGEGFRFFNLSSANRVSYQPGDLRQTTYYRLKIDSGCGTDYSDTVKVFVHDRLSIPEIALQNDGSSIICHNTAPEALEIQELPTGGFGDFTHHWQQSTDGVNWDSIPGAIGNTYQVLPLTQNTYFRVESSNSCGSTRSQPQAIEVYAPIDAGEITGDSLICYEATAQLGFLSQPNGGGGDYSFHWESSSDGNLFSEIPDNDMDSYDTGELTSNAYCRVIVQSNLGCSQDTSNVFEVNVRQPFMAGSVAENDTICFNSRPELFTIGSSCSGGAQPYTYQWYISTSENSDYEAIHEATDSMFQSDNLTQTTYFKLKFISAEGCGQLFSNPIEVFVYDSLSPAIVSVTDDSPICYGTSSDELYVQSPTNGADGNFIHQWQISEDGEQWENINGADSSSYLHPILYGNQYFRLVDSSSFGCGTAVSDPILVEVYPQLDAGVIGVDDTICYAASVDLNITQFPSGGGDTYSYQWFAQIDSTTVSALADADTTILHCDSLLQTTSYKLVVSSNLGCGQDTTNVVTVYVRDPFTAGSIVGNDTICYNTQPASFAIDSLCFGGALPYTYQWQRYDGDSLWVNVEGAEDDSLQVGELAESTSYRLQFSSSDGCGTGYSDSIYVYVYDEMQPATIYSDTDSIICFSTAPSPFGIITPATGGGDLFSYQWQSSIDGTIWNDIENAADTVYNNAPELTQRTFFRLVNNSLFGCGNIASDPIIVAVYDEIDAGVIGNNDSICYMSDATISYSSAPTGGGNSYSFQWLKSNDGVTFQPTVNSNDDFLYTGLLDSTAYYKAVVVSSLGCSQDTTNVVQIFVRDPFVKGTITDADTACINQVPNPLSYIENCSGGAMPYSYQWQVFDSLSMEWTNIAGAINNVYQPDTITQLKYYRLQFISSDNCGNAYSDSTWIDVQLPPSYKPIVGDDWVCLNQYDVAYTLSIAEDGVGYNWEVIGGEITEQLSETSIVIHWDDSIDNGEIVLMQYNTLIPSCTSTSYYKIQKTDSYSPDKTQIVRKENSNILICAENDSDIIYEWGFVEKSSRIESLIPDSDAPYILVPHDIDTTVYDYFVLTQYQDEDCVTRTYYKCEQSTLIEEIADKPLKVYPNPVQNDLWIDVNGAFDADFKVLIFNTIGQLCSSHKFYAYELHKTVFLNINLDPGLYLVQATDGKRMFVNKIVVK